MSQEATPSPMLGLRTTLYQVADLNEAKAWYTQAFGTAPYFDEPFYVGFNIGGYELGLLPGEAPSPKGTNVLSYWGVEDIQTEYQRLLTLGATEHEPPTNRGGELMTAAVIDPWGNPVGIIYNPYFELG